MSELLAENCYRFFRRSTWDIYKQLKKEEHLPLAELKKMQWKKVKHLLDFAYDFVPYYHDLFKKNNIAPEDIKDDDDLNKIPISTKADLSAGFPNRVVAKNVPQERWIYHSTSGSSGNPFQFILDDNFRIYANARQLRINDWIDFNMGNKQINVIGAHEHTSYQKKLFNFILNHEEIMSTDAFHKDTLIAAADLIMKKKPRLIHGYPSAIYTIAHFMLEKGLDVDWGCCVTSTSETITNHQKKVIEEVIGQVYNCYGSREFRVIAHECVKREGLHINMEGYFVEFIKDDCLVSEGETGQVIVTGLDNLTMPLIRYAIGDDGSFTNEMCSCGRNLSLIKKIDGRITDFISMPSGRKIPFMYFNALLENCGKFISNFQIIKQGKKLNIHIVPTKYFTEETRKMIEALTNKITEREIEVVITLVSNLGPEKSGKLPQVKIVS